MSAPLPEVKSALRLAFNRCPGCGEKSLIYGHWLRWCNRRNRCDWYGPQPTKEMREVSS